MATTDEVMDRPAIDFSRMVSGIDFLRCAWRPRQVLELCAAITKLRSLPLPPAYVDGLQDELLQMVGGTMLDGVDFKVYLAFYGAEGRAEFVKVGIAKVVKRRLRTFSTGNPLRRICAYAAPLGSRKRAMQVEAKLLAHMGPDRAHGEWVKLGIKQEEVPALVETLALVSAEAAGKPVKFEPVE